MTQPTELVIAGPRPLRGRLRLPGCKGISHRALLLAAYADGPSTLRGLADGDDVHRTRAALHELGVRMYEHDGALVVEGRGIASLQEPARPLDCGNSATTMRMLTGVVAGRPFRTVLTGDESLTRRPMDRVVAPLRAMGATIDGDDGGTRPPLEVRGADLTGKEIELAVPSGQVKTALILAGLQARGTTQVREPAPSRDHTERMLAALGAPIERVDARTVRVRAGAPVAFTLDVPGDPSSAAFFVVAAVVTPGSHLLLEDVALNPGRIAYVDVLRRMGARIEVRVHEERLGEPVGDLEIDAGPLTGTEIHADEATIDEVPALAVAAAFAKGITEIHGAVELRVKESDRIATLEQELGQLGVGVETRPDGLAIRGGSTRAATVKSHGDHRIAMAAAVAANATVGESRIRGWQAVTVSYPRFGADLSAAAGTVIAIDGPSGAGKSTVARGVAERFDLEVLDTGAMYRAVTLAVLEQGEDSTDAAMCVAIARAITIETGAVTKVDGRDVSRAIRGPDVTAAVSTVSAHPAVRSVLVEQQRGWVAERGGGVVEGRDIGSVVFPNATLKVFLTASEDERAARRQRDEAGDRRDVDVDAVRKDIDRRDRLDSTRTASPLRPAADAVMIDTTGRSPADVVDEIVGHYAAATGQAR